MREIINRIVAGLVLLAVGGTTARAAIYAHFDAGVTTSQVDGYRGMIGDGWLTQWGLAGNTSTGTTRSATVVSTNPLDTGTGNYLEITHGTTWTSGQSTRVARQYGDFGGVALNAAHTVSFLFRVDAGLDDQSSFRFLDYSSSNLQQIASEMTWQVTTSTATTGFRFTDGAVSTGLVNSNVRLFEGDSYLIRIDLDPVNANYVGYVENLDYTANSRTTGVDSFTTETLSLVENKTAAFGYLNFVSTLRAATDLVPERSGKYSIDSLSIIPEPGSLGLLATAGILMLLRRRYTRG